MPKFRITYHTAGGGFRRELEAPDAAQAEAAAWATLAVDPIRYESEHTSNPSEKISFLIRPAYVAAISVENEPVKETDGRKAGLLGSR
ncbi:MAG: hypothetical protein NTX57_06150 [Armatimonadetes bacterium]|jgi:hypothetical protein|nr:hypothetical protein [Armatimonadota bacterium]